MSEPVLAEWEYTAARDSASVIIPDGCQDLIFCAPKNARPYWRITSLDARAYRACIMAGDHLKGYRLNPGTLIAHKNLLRSVQMLDEHGDIADRIGSFTARPSNIKDALERLGQTASVRSAAADLGVNMRFLQRLLKPTGRTPAGWRALARARKAARAAVAEPLANTAFSFGYTDQPHMNREFKRWFGFTPAQIKEQPAILSQFEGAGYF